MRALLSIGLLSASVAGMVIGCGRDVEPSGGRTSPGATSTSQVQDPENPNGVQEGSDAGAAAAVTAFKETLHPLLTQRCGACHGASQAPKFAVTDAAAAYQSVEESGLINRTAIPDSRLVKRLTQQAHQCWSDCPLDGKRMEDDIRAFIARDAGGNGDADKLVKLDEIKLNAPTSFKLRGGTGNDWILPAAYPDGLGGLYEAKATPECTEGMALSRVEVPADTPPEDRPRGGAMYLIEVPPTGEYILQFHVMRKPEVQGTYLNYRINGQDFQLPDQGGADDNRFIWVSAFGQLPPPEGSQQSPGPRRVKLSPLKGIDRLVLEITDATATVCRIGLTANPTFPANAVVNTGVRTGFTWDLFPLIGKHGKFSVEYSKTPDGLSHTFSRPTIEVEDQGVYKIKSQQVIFNGELNKQFSTFSNVDETLDTAKDGLSKVLSRGTMLIPVKDDNDSIKFGFEILSAQ